MEAHDDHIDLLYLTDSEVSLQNIHKWIDGGAKMNLSKRGCPQSHRIETIKESGSGGNDSADQSQGPMIHHTKDTHTHTQQGGPLE